MPKKFKPGVGWAVVTPPNYSLGDMCMELLEYSDGPATTAHSYYGAVYYKKVMRWGSPEAGPALKS